ncbi:glutathione S-transferase alpha-4-like [Papio anubis]|uniref:glutathione S-transferase alpha-4-like n=1 Tax=Papio anubis TaxID=9555 RepID=UPI000B7AFD62|nr:glutathione S-transferase alpha-4-like [Papio anubis]
MDMYIDGTQVLMMMIIMAPFKFPEEKQETLASIMQKAKTRYLPAFEKILNDHREDFLVGNKFSWADIQLLEAILMMEERSASVLSDFPLLKSLELWRLKWCGSGRSQLDSTLFRRQLS